MDLEDFKKRFDEIMRNTTDEELVAEFKAMGCDVEILPMKLKEEKDIPRYWKRLTVRKKTPVRIRSCNGVEEFKVAWSDKPLISDPTVDLIIIQPNGSEYPIKTDIFNETYVPKDLDLSMAVDMKVDTWVKKATTTIVEIPEGVTPFEIETLEGTINNVSYPDYVAIGPKGELYTNTKQFVDDNLEILVDID
jgi:hypothetical protein